MICLIFVFVSCGGEISKPAFDGKRAFGLIVAQVELGPRNPGSKGWNAFQTMLGNYLDSIGVPCSTQPFDYYDYLTGDTVHLVNWIGRINPSATERILVGAHYDCRPRADFAVDTTRRKEPIAGANDGASGVAALMHLAELMVLNPPRIGVDLIFFDGEDYGPAGRLDQYLLGSAYFARHNKVPYKYGIILDMIGDNDLKIYREEFSELHAKEINDRIWTAAALLNVTVFIDSVRSEVLDDHLPLMAAGIPTVDIIDFEYPHWHTHRDTPDKCSPASLEAVGKVILEVVYDE